ncbi:protein containing diguanylate cyclase (GGDEF) domain [Anaerolinea thermolimosa]|nr:GGDEF domain-containing protein [Anaerolinea thermolimosa]GAP07661.1 protein containing diguanylate cyclase (GGDEF) domain [Anaerolinea thermolimosa]
MVNFPPGYVVELYIGSIPNLISAMVILMSLGVATLTFPFTGEHWRPRALILFLVPVFFYVLGYGMYTSGRTVEEVEFWTRVSFTGLVFIPPAFEYLVQAFTGERRKTWLAAVAAVHGVWALAIILRVPGVFGRDLATWASFRYPVLQVGPWYTLLPISILISATISWGFLFRYFLRRKSERFVLSPLVFGFLVWLLLGFFDGLVALGIFRYVDAQPWLGAIVMLFLLSLYYFRFLKNQNQALQAALVEKRQFYEQVARDSLTGVRSRKYLTEVLEEVLKRPAGEGVHSLLFIDLDNLKMINDRFGHLAGDRILQYAGEVLLGSCRSTDVVARMGGDEFIVLLWNCPEERAVEIAVKMRSRYQFGLSSLGPDVPDLPLTMSIGILSSDHWGKSLDDVIGRADAAMYAAKSHGKDRVVCFRGFDPDGKMLFESVVTNHIAG